VNDSTSTITPVWPTRWPDNSFKNFWTWFIAISIALFLAAIFVSSLLLQSLLAQTLHALSPQELLKEVGYQAIGELALVAVILALMPYLSKFSLRELGFRVPSWQTIGIAVLGAIAMVVIANGGASLIDYFAHSKHQQDVVEIFKNLHDPKTIALFAIFAIVFAPFAEESLFRIFFFNLGLRFGGFGVGATISGVLFGLAHGDLYAAIPLALGGAILCYVYYRTRNAFASMISHGLFNSFSILMLLAVPGATN